MCPPNLPYAITCAAVSGVTYLIAGILVSMGAPGLLGLPIGIVLMIGALFVIRSNHPSVS